MLDLMFVALFQVAAGDPAAAPPTQDATVNEATETAPTTEAAAGQAAGNTAPAQEEEMICRREPVTGSNLRRRVCRTRAEIQRLEEDTQHALANRGRRGPVDLGNN